MKIPVLCGLSMLTFCAPALATGVIIEINNTATSADDYICWSPVEARIKLSSEEVSPVEVTITQARIGSGSIGFVDDHSRPLPGEHDVKDSLTLTLPANAGWKPFWIVGRSPSSADKDVAVVAADNAGTELGRAPLMVRVRKNADSLLSGERNRFLSALRKLHDLDKASVKSEYVKYYRAHDDAFSVGIHGGPAGVPLFLAWHRAFLLSFERELQAIDPSVSIPYWIFDKPSTKIFTRDFMGTVAGGQPDLGLFLVEFAPTNPLRNWAMPDGRGPLVRGSDGGSDPPVPAGRLDALFAQPWTAAYGGPNGGINGGIELFYHNAAHSGINGWLNTGSSPRDPLFYLLHANVDRAWAHWQSMHQAFDPDGSDGVSYSASGLYPGPSGSPSRFRKGSYAKDVMWPWSDKGGDAGTSDPLDDWPTIAFPMPPGYAGSGPQLPPTPASVIDYLDTKGRGLALNACYDDINFEGQAPIGGGP